MANKAQPDSATDKSKPEDQGTRENPERFDEYDFGSTKGDYGPLQCSDAQNKRFDEFKARKAKPKAGADEGEGESGKDDDKGGNA